VVGHCRPGRIARRYRQCAQRGDRQNAGLTRLGTFLTNEGAEAQTMTPQQFGDMMRSETERWTRVAREANISID